MHLRFFFYFLFFLRIQSLCSANRRVASDLQQLNTQQQFSANDASYFPPEAAEAREAWRKVIIGLPFISRTHTQFKINAHSLLPLLEE